jgi:diacylglycerol kinase (ATP)
MRTKQEKIGQRNDMLQRMALIYNPSAGGGKALRRKRRVESTLKLNNIQYDLFVTRNEAHLVETAESVVHKYPIIIGAGGDTTLNIIATQILQHQTKNKLGVISLGSVNDLAREIGVHKLEDAVNAIRYGITSTIDVGIITSKKQNISFYFLVSASLGLGVAVNRYVDIWMRNHPIFSAFRAATQQPAAMSAIHQAFKNKYVPLKLTMESQGERHHIDSAFLIFCNTPYFGGLFRPSPTANLRSGKLDCCIFDFSSLAGVFKVSIDIRRQKHLEKDEVKVFQDDYFKINSKNPLEFQADGEIIELEGEVEVSVIPKALTVIANPDFFQ